MSNNLPMSDVQVAMAAVLQKATAVFSRSPLEYETEKVFALQQLLKSDYSMQVALNNRLAVQLAMENVAAVGLTLNPLQKKAFLIPRDSQIVYDVSYRGMLDIAIRDQAIVWAAVQLVYQNDHFEYRGPNEEPIFDGDPLMPAQERGPLRGGFILYRLPCGDVLNQVMRWEEIARCRQASVSYKAYLQDNRKLCAWVSDFEEMVKKTIIKRAWKTWVGQGSEQSMALLSDILNVQNGEGTLYEEAPGSRLQPKLSYADKVLLANTIVTQARDRDMPWESVVSYIYDRFRTYPNGKLLTDELIAIVNEQLR